MTDQQEAPLVIHAAAIEVELQAEAILEAVLQAEVTLAATLQAEVTLAAALQTEVSVHLHAVRWAVVQHEDRWVVVHHTAAEADAAVDKLLETNALSRMYTANHVTWKNKNEDRNK